MFRGCNRTATVRETVPWRSIHRLPHGRGSERGSALGHRFKPRGNPAFVSRRSVPLDNAPFRGAVNEGKSGWKRGLGGALVLLFNQTADGPDLVAQLGLAK